ncbi:hypothetical protein [Microbacterium profundi]|uniref:hypothetical protein n=1 Tax=Microbacterium profundi TaxID=450380 RepID=UPI00051A034C|nr:hypothetical protein [Microbacterium profundi]
MTLEGIEGSTLHITTLLRRLQWAPASKAPGRYEVWSPSDSDIDEVVIPLNPESGDYRQLLERARRYLLHRYGSEAERIEALILISAAADLDSTQ